MSKSVIYGILLLTIIPICSAHDQFIPPWRGQDGTAYLEWTFDDAANPTPPNVNTSAITASALIDPGNMGSGWLFDVGFGTQTGYWDMLSNDGNPCGITLTLDGLGTDEGELWLQLTYFDGGIAGDPPLVRSASLTPIGSEPPFEIEDAGLGDYWYLDQSKWTKQDGTDAIEIFIEADTFSGSVVDQIVIDYKTIPEPATLLLILFGAPILIQRSN